MIGTEHDLLGITTLEWYLQMESMENLLLCLFIATKYPNLLPPQLSQRVFREVIIGKVIMDLLDHAS
jgi:hypothetical protein